MGEFSGIDSKALNTMMGSYKKDKDALRSGASSIKSRFERHGIDTQSLTELLGICGWLDDQMPMLTRRYHLAVASDDPYSGFKGMVSIDESKVGQTAQAQQNGKSLAEKFKTALDNGDAVPEDLFAQLDANSDDADYIKAFYEALGPDKLVWLSNDMASHPYDDRYDKHPEQLAHDRDVIAKTLGIFTQVAFEGQSEKDKQASWNKWFDKFVMDPHRGFRPDRLMPLLKGGTYDKDFLVALGDRAFAKDHKISENEWMNSSGKGPWDSDHYTQLFDAIAQNPEASGEWMDHNYDAVQNMMYPAGPWRVDEPPSRSEAFLKIMHEGTIELRATNEDLAEKLTAHLMFDNYMHTQKEDTKSIHPIDGVDYFYSEIISSYWKDMEYGITSPIADKLWMGDVKTGSGFTDKQSKWDYKQYLAAQDPSRRGIEAGSPMWQALMNEAARDPKGAGRMSALFDSYKKQIDAQVVHTDRGDDNNTIQYLSMKRGLMLKAYGQAFTSAMASHKDDATEWANSVNAARAAMIDTAYNVATTAATGGGQAVADMGKEQITGAAADAATELLTGWLKEAVSVKPEDAPDGLADKYKKLSDMELDLSWQQHYRDLANEQLAVDPVSNPKGGFNSAITKQVTVGPIGKERTPYTGNPLTYIHSPAENFLNPDGTVMEIDELEKSPQKLAAYGRWLQDYAVVNKVENDGFTNGEMMQRQSD
jgi:hypothetical protein